MPFDQSNSTLSDAIAKLEALPNLPDVRRRDLISAITRIATFLNRAPSDLPTDAPSLRAVLATIHPTQAGISAKSLSNVKANLAKALQISRFIPRDLPKMDRTPGWETFFQSTSAKHQEWALARFAAYCCSRGMEPDAVTDAVMKGFQSYLDARVLNKDPAKLCKEMAQTWNGIVNRNTLPLTQLSYDPNPQYRCLPLTSYPLTLQNEIANYLKQRAVVDEFDIAAPDDFLKPTSLRNTEAHIRQFLDALVGAGQNPDQMTRLTDVVSAEKLAVGLMAHNKRRGRKGPSASLHNITATLIVIARNHLKLDQAELNKMREIKKKASVKHKGMTAKNSKRLMQFNDSMNLIRLVTLPDVLMQHALANKNNRTSALMAMYAAAIAILFSCPVRAENLATIDTQRHLITNRNGNHTIYNVRIEGTEVKNEQPIEFRMTHAHSAILHQYMTTFRAQISEVRGTALFPQKRDGLPRSAANFSNGLMAQIYRETGIKINTHLFRHLTAKIYLDRNPGHYEMVRQMLKHKNIQTTIKFYAEFSSQRAHDTFSAILSEFGGSRD
jgi:integrase